MILIHAATAALLAGAAAAQTQFAGMCNGAAEVPSVVTPAVGRAYLSLDPQTLQLYYRVEHNVVGAFAANLYQAPAGSNGPIVFALTPAGGAEFRGFTAPLTPAQITTLYSEGFYINILSTASPTGEIRAQVTKSIVRHLAGSLNGAQVVPSTVSTATGTAAVTLHIPENRVTYRVTTTGIPPLCSADLHLGAAGSGGPALFPLQQETGTSNFSGVSPILAASDVASLLATGVYVDIHTTAFPGGEIRAQLIPQKELFAAQLDGAHEAPPTPSTSTGTGVILFDPATSGLGHSLGWTGAGASGANAEAGFPGTAGPVVASLVGPPAGPWLGSAPLTPADVTMLFAEGLYCNILSTSFPGGEIRGQIMQDGARYGFAGSTSAGTLGRILRIDDWGRPQQGTAYTIQLFGAQVGAFSALAYCEDLLGTPLDLAFVPMPSHFLWGNALASYTAPAALNTGYTSLTFQIPVNPLLVGQDFFFQWLSLDGNANPAGLVTSDALRIVTY